ncbi:hypothetical protein [Aquirhabdus parva]|uniref:Uncharacterized protein n=1 Tax=Aquirhabdus parva TaxID=2283318 RepID=A0A345P456_9GAMM|nr:hypothetical protein [Aquirhabdus parva]AXI02065.1 hypothetical protein HYN46_03835 [Aquirhabdus parva]
MKQKKANVFKERNHLALHPLLHKGGVNHNEKVDVARQRERRALRQSLNHTDWLGQHPHGAES